MRPPQLSSEAVRVLKVILDNKVIRGGELMRISGMKTPSDLAKPVKELQDQSLIEVSGEVWDENMLPFATFGSRPSAREYLSRLAT